MRPSFYYHLHPPSIPLRQARWRYTLGAGGISVFLSLVVLLSGVFLVFYYTPTPAEAGLSVQTITFLVPFGWFIRNLHYWSAQALVVTAVVHLGRVVLSGSYVKPRRFNYLLGICLLLLILLLDFTGYILRWDEGIHWALVVGTNLVKSIPLIGMAGYRFLVGGRDLGAATLLRFYAWHLFGLTLPFIFLIGWHIFRVRHDGGIAAPPVAIRRDRPRLKRVDLVRREILAAVVCAALLVMASALFPAPLAPPMRAAGQPGFEAAPWFFLWLQTLLRYGDPFWMGVCLPAAILTLLILIPYVIPQPVPEEWGEWLPKRGRLAQVIFTAIAVFILTSTILAVLR